MQVRPSPLELVGRNVLWLVGDRVFRMALGMVVLAVLARHLGPAQFGVLHYAIGLAAVFAAIASFGIEGIVIREMVKQPDKTHQILGAAFGLRVLGAAIATVLVYLCGLLTHADAAIAPLALLVALGFLPQSMDVIDLWFQRNIQSKYTVIAKTVAAVVGTAVKIWLVMSAAPLIWFGAALSFDALLISFALMVQYQLRGQSIWAWSPNLQMARLIVKDSWPLILSGLLVALYVRVEQIMVMNMLGAQSAGIYYSAVRVSEVWMFLPTMILSSIYPLLVERRGRDQAGYLEKLQSVFDLLTGLGFFVAVVVSFLAPFIIPLLFGDKYGDAVVVLIILAWSAPIIFSGTVRAQYFLLENLTIYHTWSALTGIATNVGLAWWLMPRYGISGAALGALIGYFVSAFVTSWMFGRLRECALFQTRAFLLPFRMRSAYSKLKIHVQR